MALGIKSFKGGFARGKKISSTIGTGTKFVGRGLGTGIRIAKSPARGRFLKGKTAGFRKFMGVSNKAKVRFLRPGFKKGAKNARRFFKKSRIKAQRWIRNKKSLLRRKWAEKSLEARRSLKKGILGAIKAKGFNPLKFVMAIFAGWLINKLPGIIAGIKKFINRLKPAFEILRKIVKGILKFFKWIGGGLAKLWKAITGDEKKITDEGHKLKSAGDKLKSSFEETKKGHDDLVLKAKKEESNLKSMIGEQEGDKQEESTSSSTDDSPTLNSAPTPTSTTSTTSSSNSSTSSLPKLTSTPSSRRIGTGKPVTVEIKGKTVILQPGTVEYNNFFMPGGSKDKIIGNKVKDVNLVQTKDGPKIVTIDIPVPSSKTSTPQLNIPSTGGSSGGVNSRDLLLHSIEK
tara:strand:+ start:1522 stop:2724 length:1203 start_codon:yes stop_codon:yes gene_type:complete